MKFQTVIYFSNFVVSDPVVYDKLFVVGGYISQAEKDVEVVDLSGQNLTCKKPKDFPVDGYSFGTFIDGHAIGFNSHNLSLRKASE